MISRGFLVGTLLVGILVAMAGFAAGGATYGLFFDSETGSGTIQAADSFGLPDDAIAYDDANRDGSWTPGETGYTPDDLSMFSDGSVHLTFLDSVNNVRRALDVNVASITGHPGLQLRPSKGGDAIQLRATNDIDLSGMTIRQATLATINSTTGNVDISGAKLKQNSGLTVHALQGTISIDKHTQCKDNSFKDVKDASGTRDDICG